MSYVSIGWIGLDENGIPARSNRSGYSWEVYRKGPTKMYRTKKLAEAYSTGSKIVEVFMKEDNE